MSRQCIDDHIVNQGDGKGLWYLYDTYEFNDGPPVAEFSREEVARDVVARLNEAQEALEAAAKDKRENQLALEGLAEFGVGIFLWGTCIFWGPFYMAWKSMKDGEKKE